ncbi:MAG: Peptidase protein, partial [Chloroflexi bacterium]|nr:Peptidase protein [Chloroflexota bacterium]
MLPGIAPGDWLLVDPTIRRWPRVGTVVLVREPETDELAIKRVAGLAGDRIPFGGGFLIVGPDEAWLAADASVEEAAAAG